MSLLLDLANILGGLLLAVPLLGLIPTIGEPIARFAAKIAPWSWLIGIVALVAGGYFLIVHLFSGPRLLHFEVVGIAVGVLLAGPPQPRQRQTRILLWDRLTGHARPEPSATGGPGLILSIFGIIAILVGLQGLFTPN